MSAKPEKLWFGTATQDEEFEQIFRLNHRTFVDEIPQHAAHDDGRLVDRFHADNRYVICKDREEVVGMIALRGRRPFSLDAKLPDLDRYLPRNRSACEIRLLAVRPGYRHSRVLPGLVRELGRVCRESGHEYAVISGTTRQLRLYAHLGFEPFGPLVGKSGAYYQPMGISIERFTGKVTWLALPTQESSPPQSRGEAKCFLPGPANIHPAVISALASFPKPHRSPDTASLLGNCRKRLAKITRASDVQILLGSGTLANDAIAQQLRLMGKPGLVLSNGEFGERLVDHARRSALAFTTCRAEWGKPFDFDAVRRSAETGASPSWLWMAHCETSTGVLNDLPAFKRLARGLGAKPVLDCISSVGSVDVDLNGITLASGVSGKGLAALPGLAFVFHRRGALRRGPGVPRYLDLALYAACSSVPFTHSSNLLAALDAALDRVDPESNARRAAISSMARAALATHGLKVVDDGTAPAPFVVSIALPRSTSSARVGEAMLARGWRVAFESGYLRARNWIQIAWMGDIDGVDVLSAIDALAGIVYARRQALKVA